MKLSEPLPIAGIILGMGLGGFFDGIVLHQILQWHHLVCVTEHCQPTSIEQLKQQNRQDGFFHLGVWVLTIVGCYRMFRAAGPPVASRAPGAFWGSLLCGWGIFNFVEGLIDHQILGIHHVLPGSDYQFMADMIFLASGPALFIAGWLLVRRAGMLS
ncbi:MAG TPA: DUF2243 domain-containing protein [Chthoniobacteraceae bacterium]|jgi:uncharacterized membrane protein